MLTIARQCRRWSQLVLTNGNVPCHSFHISAVQNTFWEREKKSGYKTSLPEPSKKQLIIDGFKELREEIQLWKNEMKERLESDPILVYRPGETDIVFDFKEKQSLDKWTVTTDSDHAEGRSTATLGISNSKAGLFSGEVNSEHIKDGVVKRTGYANIRTKRVRVSVLHLGGSTKESWHAFSI